MSRDIVIDKYYAWDWNSSDVIHKPLMSQDFDEASNDVEVEAVPDMPDTVEVEDGVAITSQRPQRTRS